MDFSHALRFLKKGVEIRREAWDEYSYMEMIKRGNGKHGIKFWGGSSLTLEDIFAEDWTLFEEDLDD